jgi:hypothetical protein
MTYEFKQISDGGLETSIKEFNINSIRSRDPVITVTSKIQDNVQVNVSVTIAATGATSIYYRVDTDASGTWIKYTSAFSLTANATVYAYALSNTTGQSNTVSRAISGFGKTSPAISVNISQDYSFANITITDSSGSATIFYRIGNNAWTRYTGAFNVTQNSVISAKSSLGTLESETVSWSVTGIGIDSPINQILIAFSLDPSEFFGTVTIRCDNAKEILFQINLGTFDRYNTFWLKEEGPQRFYSIPFALMENCQIVATATLKDGRVPGERVLNIDTIKNTSPEIKIEYAQDSGSASVAISNPALASIYYFINDEQNRLYIGPFTVRSDGVVNAQGKIKNVNKLSLPASAVVDLSVPPPTIRAEYSLNKDYVDISFVPANPYHRIQYRINDRVWANYD